MDLSKDRSRLDFFLRKAKTAPPASAPPVPAVVPEGSETVPSKVVALKAAAQELAIPSEPDASAAACRAVSAPADLAADSAADGLACGTPADLAADLDLGGAARSNMLEAERDCNEAQEGCGSEACSEWGEDTGAVIDADNTEAEPDTWTAAVDLVLPPGESGAGVDWQDHSFRGRQLQEGAMRSCSGKHSSRHAAELVHLGLSSPPDVSGQSAELPIANAVVNLHDQGAFADSTAPARAADTTGHAMGVWPTMAELPSDSATDSWGSDSWDCAVTARDSCRDAAGRMQQSMDLDSDRGGESRLLTAKEHQPVQLQSNSALHRLDMLQHAGICGAAAAEEQQMDCPESRPGAEEEIVNFHGNGDSGAAEPEAGIVDLARVDVAEQERILRAIQLQRRVQPRAGGDDDRGVRKRGQGPAAGGTSISLMMGSQTKRRQLSIGAFIMKAPSSKH